MLRSNLKMSISNDNFTNIKAIVSTVESFSEEEAISMVDYRL